MMWGMKARQYIERKNMEIRTFAERRQSLMKKLGKGSVVVIPGAKEVIRNGDAHYPFRQNSDFYYLTGFCEPEAVLVLTTRGSDGEFILFNRPNDPKMETWTGKRAGQQGSCQHYGANRSYPTSELKTELQTLLANCQRLYYPLGQDYEFDQLVIDTLNVLHGQHRSGIEAPEQIFNIQSIIHEMRLFKSADEVMIMRQCAALSAEAHKKTMQICRPGMKEYDLEAELLRGFYSQGSRYPAYPSIVAGGGNACVLHYNTNDCELISGDLVLVDAGAELHGYAADITRTFPVNGRFSQEQRQLYELVLKAQLAVINKIRPGVFWNVLQETAVSVLSEGLVELGLLSGKVETLIEKNAYQEFYMHSSGHWLGLDVHDVGAYKLNQSWRPLQPGMVLTVEPGLYINAGNPLVDDKWWNIGIRIEDDVLVTETGFEVLSHDVPKTVEEIEDLMKK